MSACKHDLEFSMCVRCLRDKVAAADEMAKAARSYAGDTGLYYDAWLWDKIEEYENAGLASSATDRKG